MNKHHNDWKFNYIWKLLHLSLTYKEKTRGWLWLQWESKFDKKLSNKDANKGWLRIIALGIFGLVLFAAYTNLIDYEAINILVQVKT